MGPTILVTGDVVLDHNIYAGRRLTPDSRANQWMRYSTRPGGAMLTHGILEALTKIPFRPGSAALAFQLLDATSDPTRLLFGLKETTAEALRGWPPGFMMGAVWEAYSGPGKDDSYWRIAKNLGYGQRVLDNYPASMADDIEAIVPDILVIDDGGLGFRLKTASRCWPPIVSEGKSGERPAWILLKMSAPLARGDLWRILVQQWSDRLVVIVAADNLRREDVKIIQGLSWESTADDLMEAVDLDPVVQGLDAARHLVVTLRGDAALWLDRPGDPARRRCRLVFDREMGEGESEDRMGGGQAFGYLSAITAALARHLRCAPPGAAGDLVPALKAGLSASRLLNVRGHGPVNPPERAPEFPFEATAEEIYRPRQSYSSVEVSCGAETADPTAASSAPSVPRGCNANRTGYWTILRKNHQSEALSGPLYGPARRLALLGPGALADVPCARFGKLLTMDRREVEALRSLRQLMVNYHKSGPQNRPLSLAVFGAPGSGKSFGLKQIGQSVFGGDPPLEFNLSQFTGPGDLIGAYHQVRDRVLAGQTPMVFWDEFDSRGYFWLQYLLAPMQDGVFQEGQLSHSIGKSVFVFCGGTSRDFAHFGPCEDPGGNPSIAQQEERASFVMAKGPDFRSRLSGYLDVLGPNARQVYDAAKAAQGLDPWENDPTDLDFPVRRAILLRSLLGLVKERETEPIDIDRGLLTALLEVGHYRHGARSMEKLIEQIRGNRGENPLRRAYLPCDDLLALYVDSVPGFQALMRRSYAFLAQAERLAPIIHQDWRDHLPDAEKDKVYNVPYDDLDQEGKAANVAAARRIPEILALAGFTLAEGEATSDEEASVVDFLRKHLDVIAKAEHDGWADQKRMEGWSQGQSRDEVVRRHALLVDYSELPEEQKDKDRGTILNYPKYVRQAGFKITAQRPD